MRKRMLKFLLIVGGIYVLLLVLSFFFQEKLMFRPTPLDTAYTFDFDQAYEEIWLEPTSSKLQLVGNQEPDSLRINGVFFPAPASSKGLILYFHGNADDLQRWGKFAADFTRLDYDFMGIDYPAYGKSTGKLTEENIYKSAEMAYDWAIQRYAPEHIIVFGRSLGCTPASYIASIHPSQQLILETPFYSVEQLMKDRFYPGFRPLLTDFEFPVHKFLTDRQCPATIIQGTADEIVPYSCAIRLKSLLKENEQFIVIDSGKHKNLNTFEKYHQSLEALLN